MTARDVLWHVAVDQHGFVTSQDARERDISPMTVQMLVQRGQLERIAYGVYRFPALPASEFDSYMAAVLWTGVPEACLSHDTALALYDVCDINPTRIHVTVPRARRVRRSGGERYELHYLDVEPAQIGWLHEIRATRFETTLRHCIDSGVPTYLLRQALEAGGNRGLVLPGQGAALEARMEARDRRG